MSVEEKIVWPVDICEVCKEPVSLFDDRGYITTDEEYGEFENGDTYHITAAAYHTKCLEKVNRQLDAFHLEDHPKPVPGCEVCDANASGGKSRTGKLPDTCSTGACSYHNQEE